MVDVSDGYARNYLIPRKLAVAATADNINAMKVAEKARLAQIERDKANARVIADKLESLVVKIPAKAGSAGKLFGAVTSKEISDALKAQYNIDIEKHRIVQNEPIKSYGSYDVKCKFGYEINGIIHLLVVEDK